MSPELKNILTNKLNINNLDLPKANIFSIGIILA